MNWIDVAKMVMNEWRIWKVQKSEAIAIACRGRMQNPLYVRKRYFPMVIYIGIPVRKKTSAVCVREMRLLEN